MIEDARHIPADTVIEADVCIIGAGAAGLAVAYSLASTRFRICVLESGGLNYERGAQDLSRGVSIGIPYEALDLFPVRQLGGSTGRTGWGGWCKPLGPEDFQERPWATLSGWPISRKDLDIYYSSAADLLGIERNWSGSVDSGINATPKLLVEPCYLSPRADIKATLLPTLMAAPYLRIFTHATAMFLRTKCTSQFQSADVVNPHGSKFRVSARVYVLAGGGIENARLLLLSDDYNPAGLGNQHDQVGRYFMEHPRVAWGSIKPKTNGLPLALFDPALPNRPLCARTSSARKLGNEGYGLIIRPEVRETLHLLGSRTWIKPSVNWNQSRGADALQYIAFWLRKGRFHQDLFGHARPMLLDPTGTITASLARLAGRRWSPRYYRFDTILEQDPDPFSRITLDSKRDVLGSRLAKLDWHISRHVRHTLQEVQAIIVSELRQLGHTCLSGSEKKGAVEARFEPTFGWVRHHMGTTRMSEDPTTGVVDAACGVHGVRNLFVGGSSVFATGGNDMPTFTILALALRLGEHLRHLLSQQGAASDLAS